MICADHNPLGVELHYVGSFSAYAGMDDEEPT